MAVGVDVAAPVIVAALVIRNVPVGVIHAVSEHATCECKWPAGADDP